MHLPSLIDKMIEDYRAGDVTKLENDKTILTKLLPEQSVANITNVTVETTQVVIHFNLAIPTSNNMGRYQNESEKIQDPEKMDT
jgi:hypothetical protein